MTAVHFLPATLVELPRTGRPAPDVHHPGKPADPARRADPANLAVQVATVALIVILAVAAFGATIGQPLASSSPSCDRGGRQRPGAASGGRLLHRQGRQRRRGGLVLRLDVLLRAVDPPGQMPGALRDISDATPLGAGGQAIQSAAAGHWAPGLVLRRAGGLDRVRRAGRQAVPLGVTGLMRMPAEGRPGMLMGMASVAARRRRPRRDIRQQPGGARSAGWKSGCGWSRSCCSSCR